MPPPPPSPQGPDLPCDLGPPGETHLKLSAGVSPSCRGLASPGPSSPTALPGAQFPAAFPEVAPASSAVALTVCGP